MQPTPEPLTVEQFNVSIIGLITEARAMMQAIGQEGESIQTWRRVCSWLESKLPAGVTMADVDDPMLSPAANAKLRAEARLRNAAGLGPGATASGLGTGYPWGPMVPVREEPGQV